MAFIRPNGNYMIVEGIQNDYATLAIYKSKDAYTAYQAQPTQDNAPQRLGFPVGDTYSKLKSQTTDLGGMTLEEKEAELMSQAVQESLESNFAAFPRTKFEENDWAPEE